MSTATSFEFVGIEYVRGQQTVSFRYRACLADGSSLDFVEHVLLPPDWDATLPTTFVDNILRDLWLVLGISYYKLHCAPVLSGYPALTSDQADFWNTVYKKGLSEFLYRNQLFGLPLGRFEASLETAAPATSFAYDPATVLVGIGGGKDSIVSLELLQDFKRIGFVVETGEVNGIARAVAERAALPLATIGRQLDPQLIAGVPGAYKGHVPISAVYAFLGVLQAALSGASVFVVSNEQSSNFGNLNEEGNDVNHQWSKSAEFEQLFQTYVRHYLTPDIIYFSLLRPLYELRVVEHFATLGKRYFDIFSSCNKNFAHTKEGRERWCNTCAKCAFNHLLLAAWLPPATVQEIFGVDLLNEPSLLPLYQDILGYGTMKPFDCVGTFAEARYALALAAERRPDMPVVIATYLERAQADREEHVLRTTAAPTIPSRFRLLGMKSALLLGYGTEGKVTEQFLAAYHPSLVVAHADQSEDPQYLDRQHQYDICIKTPGIPQHLVTAHQTTATELFFSKVDRRHIIGITGSKGKSTTASLIAAVLRTTGRPVELVGNIGVPLLAPLVEGTHTPDTMYVCELSSYQTETLDVSPHIAVITSLFPDHLDHHGSLDAYYEAKHQLMRWQKPGDKVTFHMRYATIAAWAANSRATYLPPRTALYENQRLPGAHMEENVALVAAVAEACGVDLAVVREVVDAFPGLPHRLELVAEHDGVRYYNDSISTTPESAMAALAALPEVETLLLGGVDRGYDFGPLQDTLVRYGVKNVVLFPESGEKMLADESVFDHVLHTHDMDEAVRFAIEHTRPGGACALSPAAPSYNLYKNFEERGEAFRQAVKRHLR